MRDPKRLKPNYARLARFHEKYCPDQRMTQMLMNLGEKYFIQFGRDFFYEEDDDFLKFAEEELKKW